MDMGFWNFPSLISSSTVSMVCWQSHSLLGLSGVTERAWGQGEVTHTQIRYSPELAFISPVRVRLHH